MNISAIKTGFDASASTYDQARRQLIPCFDEFYRTALSLIPYPQQVHFRVLDLGAGTGLLAQCVSEQFPHAHITLVDISESMLSQAQERFSAQPGRFEFITADYATQAIAGHFDIVLSALSIHHLSDALKESLFQRIYDRLPDGGLFINADQVLGATPEIEGIYRNHWLQQVRALGVSNPHLTAALERMKEDRMAPLENQLGWLRQAGFKRVNCWYKNYSFVVFSGQKGVAAS